MNEQNLVGGQNSRRLKIISVHRDYLICEKDSAIEGADHDEVKVAKPYSLRAASFDGKTLRYENWSNGSTVSVTYSAHASSNYNSRTADYQGNSLTCTKGAHIELLYPPYQVNDYIHVSTNTVGNEGDFCVNIGEHVHIIDENREGRHWKDDCGAGGAGGSVWV